MSGRNRRPSGPAWFRSCSPAREAVALLRLLQREPFEVALAHLLHIDLAANPFVDKRDKGWIFIDGHAMGLRPVYGPLRDGFPGGGVRAHLASTWE
ncbi:hypothetical protein Rleg10DRAFT_0062 [Rhizobium leguminosarum bv. trifolii WSM2012]|nr:hypothetical protein Rleg10DRAFT_0062 [Rhizobium leguminosarum bv. trifolii WSM2012]